MIKTGVGLNSYLRWGKNRYSKLREHGFSCVDFNMADTDVFPYSDSWNEAKSKLSEEKKLADASGIEIYQVHGPWQCPPNDFTKELRNKKLEYIKRSMAATSELDCRNWVIHPIMPYGTDDRGTKGQVGTFELNLEFMSKVLEVAKNYGITVCLENMPFLNFSIAKPKEILDFVKKIDDDSFKICLDTGHVAAFPELKAEEAVLELGNEIRVFHIHDNYPNGDFHLPVYFGTINWKSFSKALHKINYNGCMCLETKLPDNLPDDIYEEFCKISSSSLSSLIN